MVESRNQLKNHGKKGVTINVLGRVAAGVPIEALIEYVKLYQEGDETFEARRQLLQEQLDALKEQHAQIEATMKRLKYKISRYENAVKTGVLSWDNCPEDININHS